MSARHFFLVPGFLGEASDFDEFIRCFRRRAPSEPIEVLDWMNFPEDPTTLRLDEVGGLLSRFIRSRVKPGEIPVVLGYSLGGRLALSLRHFENVVGTQAGSVPMHFIFVSTNPGLSHEGERALRREQDHLWAQRFRHEEWSTLIESWNRQAVFAGAKREPHRDHLQNRREQCARVLETWSLAEQKDYRQELADGRNFNWVTGGLDVKFSVLARGIPHHEVIPSASHRVHLEAAEELAERVNQWTLGVLNQSKN